MSLHEGVLGGGGAGAGAIGIAAAAAPPPPFPPRPSCESMLATWPESSWGFQFSQSRLYCLDGCMAGTSGMEKAGGACAATLSGPWLSIIAVRGGPRRLGVVGAAAMAGRALVAMFIEAR